GRRTTTLFHAACVAGEFIPGDRMDRATAEAALRIVAGTRDVPDADRQIRRGIERGMRNPRNPRRDGHLIQSVADPRIASFEWTERLTATGTDLRICMAIASHCWSKGSTTVDVSYREISETCGMSTATVSRHAGRIGRWVRIARHGQRFRSGDTRTRWRLVL